MKKNFGFRQSTHKPAHCSVVLKKDCWFCSSGCITNCWAFQAGTNVSNCGHCYHHLPRGLLDLHCNWKPFLIYFGPGLQITLNFFKNEFHSYFFFPFLLLGDFSQKRELTYLHHTLKPEDSLTLRQSFAYNIFSFSSVLHMVF